MKQIHANLKPIKPMRAILGIVSRHRLRFHSSVLQMPWSIRLVFDLSKKKKEQKLNWKKEKKNFLTSKNECKVNLRNRRAFTTRRTYTTRTRNSFTYHYVNDKMM